MSSTEVHVNASYFERLKQQALDVLQSTDTDKHCLLIRTDTKDVGHIVSRRLTRTAALAHALGQFMTTHSDGTAINVNVFTINEDVTKMYTDIIFECVTLAGKYGLWKDNLVLVKGVKVRFIDHVNLHVKVQSPVDVAIVDSLCFFPTFDGMITETAFDASHPRVIITTDLGCFNTSRVEQYVSNLGKEKYVRRFLNEIHLKEAQCCNLLKLWLSKTNLMHDFDRYFIVLVRRFLF